MCTAITYNTKSHYFGRNLDLEYSYCETVTVTPRNYAFNFRKTQPLNHHYAVIGMAYVAGGYPLYYDAANEKGLAMAGLNFPGNAVYYREKPKYDNIAPFELIPWILGQCSTVSEARKKLERLNLVHIDFDKNLPLSPLHWIIADKEKSITVEAVKDGLNIYENPMGILTNNPPFDYMMYNLSNYRNLSPMPSVNRFSDKVDLPVFCQGMAAAGLPGDYTSPSRFVRAAFTKLNSVSGESENESVSQFFHILGSVEMPRGSVALGDNIFDTTVYSCCINLDRGIYYYVTYDNRQINAVEMCREDLDESRLKSFSLQKEQQIYYHN